MLNVVIFGAPGSGKGTQSERIIEEYGLFHISTGDVLREQIARGTELGKTADSYISKGRRFSSDYRSGRGLDSDACRTQCPSRCCLGA